MIKVIFGGIALFILALIGFFVFLGPAIDPALLKPSEFKYPNLASTACIAPNSKTGVAGSINDVETGTDVTYNLRTPANYNKQFAHPLIIVYAPAGTSASKSERHVHITKEATEAGFIVAFANSLRMSVKAIEKLGLIPQDIQKKWCVDPNRIYYTGHSDGGTITNALTFLPNLKNKPTAIAPSAAGMDAESLKQYACPKPLPVMVFHNTGDSHFKNFGRQAADWWAQCNQCSNELSEVDVNGCRTYKGCLETAQTYYCEGPGSHSTWPNKNGVLLNFFNTH
jgi:polyhydroxybutyrate depolymerase